MKFKKLYLYYSMITVVVVVSMVSVVLNYKDLIMRIYNGQIDDSTNMVKDKPGSNIDSSVDNVVLDSRMIEEEINKYRKANNKSELIRYDSLCDLAKIRVYEIQSNWSHEGFVERGEDNSLYSKYCNSKNMECKTIAENLAKNNEGITSVMSSWKSSVGHNDTMLGDYNVQCVITKDVYVVSLFAKAVSISNEDVSSDVDKLVVYNFDKVKFWETRKNEDSKVISSWQEAKGSKLHDEDDLNELLDLLSQKIETANTLWDGYTNTKITVLKAKELEDNYWKLSEKTSKLTVDLNTQAAQNAYKKCIESWEELEEEYDEDFSDKKGECKKYIE